MKLALKNVKHSKHASHETNNFVADLYVNGKPFAIVSNDGMGGCNHHSKHEKNSQDYKDFHKQLDSLCKWHRENVKIPSKHFIKGWYEGSLDSAVSDILVDHLITKDVKRLMSRSMIVFQKGEKGYYQYGKKKYNITADRMGWFNNQMWQQFKENWVCINNMPIDEAVAYYKAN
jgi:hypothetical protein